MKVAVGGGYPLLKSAITRRLQADGIELTPLSKEADVVILVGGCMFDVKRSMNDGHVCEYMVGNGLGCNRQFECLVDAIGELSKRAAVLVLAEGNVGQISRILQAGARGYVPESDDYSLNIGTIVREVARGRTVVGPRVASELLQYQRQIQGQFTRREIDLLQLFASGYRVKEIADRLGIAKGTIYNTLSSVYDKLGVRGALQAVLEAARRGIITLR
jgi:two-component system capsular synthesis response regulator RcsB